MDYIFGPSVPHHPMKIKLFISFPYKIKKSKNNKVQNFCCTGPSGIIMETNKLHHDLRDNILNLLGHFMIMLVWIMKRNVNSSPPSFKGRRWGNPLFLFIVHTNMIMKQSNQLRKSSRRSWCNSFVSIVMLKGTAQRSFVLRFFFFGSEDSEINLPDPFPNEKLFSL